MKRAFPNWLRKLDPLLAAEDTNHLFQAFRARRLEYGPKGWRRYFSKSHLKGSLLPALIGTAIVLTGIIAFFTLGCCALLFIMAVAPLIYRKISKRRITEAFLPMRLAGVFHQGGFHEQAAIDIWLTGASGQEVAEAIYLERRENSCRLIAGVMVAAWIIGIATFCWYEPPVSPHSIAVCLTSIYFAWELCILLLVLGIDSVVYRDLASRFAVWRGDEPLSAALGRTLRNLPALIALLVALALLVGVYIAVFVGIHWLLEHYRGSPLADLIRAQQPAYNLAVVFLIAGLAFRALRFFARRFVLRRAKWEISNADDAYNIFMAGTVLEDRDGAEWARMMFRNRPRPAELDAPFAAEQPPPDNEKP